MSCVGPLLARGLLVKKVSRELDQAVGAVFWKGRERVGNDADAAV